MYEPPRVICDVGYRSNSVCTVTSIRLSGMGPERTRISDTAGPATRGESCELERLSTAISVVEEKIRGMPYTSREPKFARERYILVVVIVAATKQGAWNICVAERHKESRHLTPLPTHSKQGRTRLRGTGSFTGIKVQSTPAFDGLKGMKTYHSVPKS
jgi:hypothetical protein